MPCLQSRWRQNQGPQASEMMCLGFPFLQYERRAREWHGGQGHRWVRRVVLHMPSFDGAGIRTLYETSRSYCMAGLPDKGYVQLRKQRRSAAVPVHEKKMGYSGWFGG